MIEHVRSLEYSNHTITFGSASPGPNMYYPRILSKIYPDKEIVTELQDENLLLDGLNKGNFQFIFLPHKIYSEDLFCTEAVCEHLYLSVVSGHPASSLKEVSFKDMDGEPFLMYTHVGFWEGIVRENMPASRFCCSMNIMILKKLLKIPPCQALLPACLQTRQFQAWTAAGLSRFLTSLHLLHIILYAKTAAKEGTGSLLPAFKAGRAC